VQFLTTSFIRAAGESSRNPPRDPDDTGNEIGLGGAID
jgi:hypothetical protein